MANPQMFVEVVTTGAQAAVTVVGHGNDVGDAFGDDKDFVIVLDSSGESADAAIDDVIVAASAAVHQGFAANSAVLSNVTTDGDIMMLVSDGGNSKEFLFANGDTADLQLGHGMATATLKTASGALTITSGAAVDIDGVGAVQVNSSGAAISIANDNIDQTVNIATGGTRTLNIGIDDGSDATTISIKGDVTMGGVTPRLTIGDAGTEDAAIVFDGNAQDYYIGLEDDADSLVIGKGSVLGTTAMMSIGSTLTLGINTTAGSRDLVRIAGSFTSGTGSGAGLHVEPTYTGDAGNNFSTVQIGGTLVEAGSGTHALVSQLRLVGNAVTNNGATTTTASTLYINAAMSGADTNNYAIFVDGGLSRFDGGIDFNGTGTLINSGSVFIGDTANGDMTVGLTINQGANDNAIISLKSSDVAHGMTARAETDTFAFVTKIGATTGGFYLEGLSEATQAILLAGVGTTEDTTKNTGAVGFHIQRSFLKSGTNITNVGADGNLFVIQTRAGGNNTARFIFDTEGSGHADIEWVAFDDYDDLALISDIETELLKAETSIGTENRHRLEKTGIIGKGSWHMENGKPRAMVNMTKLSMLHHGALMQAHERIQTLEQKLLAIEGE